MIEEARPPFRAMAWLRFRDGLELPAAAASSLKRERKSYYRAVPLLHASYKLYSLLGYKKNLQREPRVVAEAQHFATTTLPKSFTGSMGLLVVSHKTRIYIGCVLNAVSMEAKKYGCRQKFCFFSVCNPRFRCLGKSSNTDSEQILRQVTFDVGIIFPCL